MANIPEVAVYDTVTGDIAHVGAAASVKDGQTAAPLPEDYSEEKYVWDRATRAMVPNVSWLETCLRRKRDALLLASDFIEFSRRLTPEQKAEGLAWRDALFDLPATTDPVAPEWPEPPAWLSTTD